MSAKRMKLRRLLACGIMLLAISSAASAETVLTIRRATAYQLPSASATSISVAAGTALNQTAQKDGWIRVERSGITAYMKAEDVVDVRDCGGMTAYATKAAPLYKKLGKTELHGTIPAGEAVAVYALAGEIAYIECRGYKGYVYADALSKDKPEAAIVPSEDGAAASDEPQIIMTDGRIAYARENARVYARFSADSKSAILPKDMKLNVVAICEDWACVEANGKRGFMKLSSLTDEKPAPAPEPKPEPKPASGRGTDGTALGMDWWTSDIQNIFSRGTVATITDVETGISWQEVRRGGGAHADCQPLTSEDTRKLKAACGKWSWDRRAIFVTIDGVSYAASMNCKAHGGGAISNGFDGHHCIHFTNSRTHGTDIVCPLHQAAVKKALKAKLK